MPSTRACRLSCGPDGLTLDGPATAAFGYAYSEAVDFGREEVGGYNASLSAYLADVRDAGELARRLAPLSGVFGGWHFDGEALHVFSDHLGFWPVLVRFRENAVHVATRLAPLLDASGLTPKPDLRQRAFFREHGHYSASGTAYEGIHQIWGGHVYTVDADLAVSERAYVDWGFVGRDVPRSGEEMARRTWDYLRAAAERYAGHAETVVVPLSGGLDSRQLAAAAVAAGLPRLRAFTYGDAASADVRVARTVSTALDLPLTHYAYDYGAWRAEADAYIAETEGFVSPAFLIPPRAALDDIGAGECLLSGAAGNISLGGYGEAFSLEALMGLVLAEPPDAAPSPFPLPRAVTSIADAAYRRELLGQVVRSRRLVTSGALQGTHARYRMPLLEWGLLRLVCGQPHTLRSGRHFQRDVGRRHFPPALLAVPLAQDGRRLDESRFTLRSAFRSLRYRVALAFGHDLSPDFLNRAEVWRRHGPAIRAVTEAYEAGRANAQDVGHDRDDVRAEDEAYIGDDAMFAWLHRYALARSL